MGRGRFGVDFDMGSEESGEFRFLKKKQNTTIGRKENQKENKVREILSRGSIKDSIMEELELELGFKSDKDLQKGSKAIPG